MSTFALALLLMLPPPLWLAWPLTAIRTPADASSNAPSRIVHISAGAYLFAAAGSTLGLTDELIALAGDHAVLDLRSATVSPDHSSGRHGYALGPTEISQMQAMIASATHGAHLRILLPDAKELLAERREISIPADARGPVWIGVTAEGETVELAFTDAGLFVQATFGQTGIALAPVTAPASGSTGSGSVTVTHESTEDEAVPGFNYCTSNLPNPPKPDGLSRDEIIDVLVLAPARTQHSEESEHFEFQALESRIRLEEGYLRSALADAGVATPIRLSGMPFPAKLDATSIHGLATAAACASGPGATRVAVEALKADPVFLMLSEFRKFGAFDLALIITDGTPPTSCPTHPGPHRPKPLADLCGNAFTTTGASDLFFYSVIAGKKSCALRPSILTHEIGHLLGARHEITEDAGGTEDNHGVILYYDRLGELLTRKTPCRIPGVTEQSWWWNRLPECRFTPHREVGTLDISESAGVPRLARFSRPGLSCGPAESVLQRGRANNALYVKRNAPLVAARIPVGVVPATAASVPAACAALVVGSQACGARAADHVFHFNPGGPQFRESAEMLDKQIADMAIGVGPVLIAGHASSTGTRAYNYGLSEERAWALGERIAALHKDVQLSYCPYGESFAECFEKEGGSANALRAEIYLPASNKPGSE